MGFSRRLRHGPWPIALLLFALCSAVAGTATAGASGTIAGQVRDALTGSPLAGIRVEAWRFPPLAGFAVTDADGRYAIESLAEGIYTVRAATPLAYVATLYDGIWCTGQSCHVQDGTEVHVTAGEITAGIDFALERAGAITGRVTLEPAGTPFPDLSISAFDQQGRQVGRARTRTDGTYRVAGLPPGVRFVHSEGAEAYGATNELWDGIVCPARGPGGLCDLLTGTPVEVVGGEDAAGVDFTLELSGRIAGRVTRSANGSAVAGRKIYIWLADGSFVTQAEATGDGSWQSFPLTRGRYRVSTAAGNAATVLVDEIYPDIGCPGGVPLGCEAREGAPVAVRSGETTGGIDFELGQAATLAGRVTAEGSGQPVLDATVAVWSSRGRRMGAVAIDENGDWRLEGLPADSYRVAAEAPGASFVPIIDELYDDRPCEGALPDAVCDPAGGDEIVLDDGEVRDDVDFALSPEPIFTCRPSATNHCLAGGRFWVGFTWNDGSPGPAESNVHMARAGLGGPRAGTFWFFNEENLEAAVKVLDGCAINGRFWVFSSGLTSLFAGLEVIDSWTGRRHLYIGGRGIQSPGPFGPVLDTVEFSTCDAPPPGPVPLWGGTPGEAQAAWGTLAAGVPLPAGPATATAWVTPAEPASGSETAPSAACEPAAGRLCLLGGRFAVEAEWETAGGVRGSAGVLPLTSQVGALWFFRADNPELLVKVHDACNGFDRFWVFASGMTDVGVILRVTDTLRGLTEVYERPAGEPFEPVLDNRTFSTCP